MIAKGLCYKCGKKNAEGRTRCPDCLEKEADARRVARAKKRLSVVKRSTPDVKTSRRRATGLVAETPARISKA